MLTYKSFRHSGRALNLRVKTWIAASLDRLGVLNAVDRAGSRHVVFALHRVLPSAQVADCYNPYLALLDDCFDSFLKYASSEFDIVSLDEFVEHAGCGKSNRVRLATLTFDDGWVDNYTHAFPILRAHDVTATIFLPTSVIGTMSQLPEERLQRCRQRAEASGQQEHFLQIVAKDVGESSMEPVRLGALIKSMPMDRKLELLSALEGAFGVDQLERRFMTWDEVREMRDAGISFASHTHRHALITQESDDVVEDELKNSLRVLEENTGVKTTHFAYPSGYFDARVMEIARRNGFTAAVTTQDGFFTPATNRLAIPRVRVDNQLVADAHARFSKSRMRFHLARIAYQS